MPPPTDRAFRNTPNWLDFFTRQWLRDLPSTKMAYLEGWQQNPRDVNYNVPLAFLSKSPQAIQWEDVGPAGARWHGYSRTPGGQWLKAPWHPTHWREDYSQLYELMKRVFGGSR